MRIVLPLAAVLVAWAAPAGAAIVAFEFTGEVQAVSSYFESIVSIGSPVAGRLSYDTESTDSNAEPNLGIYPGATLELTIGSYAYAGDASVWISNDTTFDGFQVFGATAGADPIDGLPLNQVTLDLITDAGVYDSDALPPAPPAFEDTLPTDPPGLRLGVVPPGLGVTYQYARLLTLPEPAGPATALAAGAALATLARRRR